VSVRPLIKPLFLGAFVEPVAVDQTFFFPAGFDPVAFKEVIAFDKIGVVVIEKLMRIFGRLDRHAITRQHVEMSGAREGVDRGLDGIEPTFGLSRSAFVISW